MRQDLGTRSAMLRVMNALSGNIVALEALADEAMRIASEFADDIGSEEMREIGRQQRVRALELQGQLAALSAEYTARYHSEP